MPPKQKFAREEIVNAALCLVKRHGIDGVTARALGLELGCSPRPIFTEFKSMNEVVEEAIAAARKIYNGYVRRGLEEELAFRGVGTEYIRFAGEEPRLFELLFMKGSNATLPLAEILPAIDENSEKILGSIMKPYEVDRETALKLYKSLWLLSHGIACLAATGMCRFTGEEIGETLTDVFRSMLVKIKSNERNGNQ